MHFFAQWQPSIKANWCLLLKVNQKWLSRKERRARFFVDEYFTPFASRACVRLETIFSHMNSYTRWGKTAMGTDTYNTYDNGIISQGYSYEFLLSDEIYRFCSTRQLKEENTASTSWGKQRNTTVSLLPLNGWCFFYLSLSHCLVVPALFTNL